MHIETLPVKVAGDPFFTMNCYLISSSAESNCVVAIDPGDESDLIAERIGSRSLAAIILTHGHYDHIGAANELVISTGAKLYAHKEDAELIKHHYDKIREGYAQFTELRNQKNGSFESPPLDNVPPVIDYSLEDNELFKICDLALQVLHTPGHSQGSVCLYDANDGVLFSGDTLFWGSCGRTDFVGGSRELMHNSLMRLSKLPPETIVYPGHNEATTIGAELNRGLRAC